METTKKLNETPLIQEMTDKHTYIIVDDQGNVSRVKDVAKEYVTETELTNFIKPYDDRITTNTNDIDNHSTTIADQETYLDTITPKNTASGELVHVTDALPLDTFGTKSSGNVEQFTTTGKNKLPSINTSQTINGITFTKNNDGSITANGTATNDAIYPLNNEGTTIADTLNISPGNYKLIDSVGDYTNYFTQLYYNNSTDGSKFINTGLDTALNFTISENSIGRATVYIRSGVTVNNLTFKPMILLVSETDETYEPFTNGASPNPDYQQPIEVLEGYNLLDFNVTQNEKVKVNNNGTISINGNGGFSLMAKPITLKANKNYYIKWEILSGTITGFDKPFLAPNLNWVVKDTFMKLNFTEDKEISSFWINDSSVFENAVIRIWIATEQKPFVPYGAIGYKNIGKNILPILNATKSYKQTTITCTNGIFHDITSRTGTTEYACAFTFTNDIASANYADYVTPQGNIIELEAGVYTYSYKKISGTAPTYDAASQGRIISVFEYKNTQPYTKIGSTRIIGDTASITFTLTKKTKITLSYAYFFNTDVNSDVYFTLQLEKGSVATDYEPYKEQIVPLDLKGNWVGAINENIKDYLVTDKKKYWLVKNVGKVVLDGSEKWTLINSTSDYYEYQVYNALSPLSPNRYTFPISTHFKDLANNRIVVNGHTILVRVPTSANITTVDEFKQWLSENNVTIYYQLAEPQIIELGELPEPIKTFEGVNNIQLLANLDTEIEVVYAQDVKKYIDSKLAEISAQII